MTKLAEINAHISEIETWNNYVQNTMSDIMGTNFNKGNNKKRKFAEFNGDYGGKHKRKRRKLEHKADDFWWKKVIKNIDWWKTVNINDNNGGYNRADAIYRDENEIISSLQNIVDKSSSFAIKTSDLENEAKNRLQSIKQCVAYCNELILNKIENNDTNEILMKIKKSEINKITHYVRGILHGTFIERKITKLHWKWNAIRYLSNVNKETIDVSVDEHDHWSLNKLYLIGNELDLSQDKDTEWHSIVSMYDDFNLFTSVGDGIFSSKHGCDCNELLSLNTKLLNKTTKNMLELCIFNCDTSDQKEYVQYLTNTIHQITALASRMSLFLDFYDKYFVRGVFDMEMLQNMASELNLLSQCISKESMPQHVINSIESTAHHMDHALKALNDLYIDSYRPYFKLNSQCSLIDWINFNFLQCHIMYKNGGDIQMDRYRAPATMNNCYCFCRFIQNTSHCAKIKTWPDMIGCDECAEWFHAECIMIDDKQFKKLLHRHPKDTKTPFICPRCCYYEYNDYELKAYPSLHWKQINFVSLKDIKNILKTEEEAVILCECDTMNAFNRLINWCDAWQNDVDHFMESISGDFDRDHLSNEQIFIAHYLLNCGQISGLLTPQSMILKILLRNIGELQINLHEFPIETIQKDVMTKYDYKKECESVINDIRCASTIYIDDIYMELHVVQSIATHYLIHNKRKKKQPNKIKRILNTMQCVMETEMKQCRAVIAVPLADDAVEQYVNSQLYDDDGGEWLKFVEPNSKQYNGNVSIWQRQLNLYKNKLTNKCKKSPLQIQSVIVCGDLIDKLMYV